MTFLLFPIPDELATIRDKYQADPYYNNLFEGNNLKISPLANRYIPIFEGQKTQIIDGAKTSVISVGYQRYGFEIRLKDGREGLYRMIGAIADYSYRNPCQFDPAVCWDFMEDEGEEIGYKIRLGKISELKKQGGVVLRQKLGVKRKLSQGLTFQFMEIDKRFVGR